MEKKGNGIISILLDVAFVVVIIVAGVVTVLSLNTKEDVADIGGYIPFSIQTPSMEKTIMQGDLIITKEYNGEELKVGDVISFYSIEQEKKIVKTHRITEIQKDGNYLEYVTKGDNNQAADSVKLAPGDIISVYEGSRVPMVGYAMDFFRSKYGFLFGIILPIFVFFIYQLYVFFELLIEMKLENRRAKG